MTPPSAPSDAEPDVSAAELALGLLDGAERSAALHHMLRDPAFAVEVEQWRAHLGDLFDLWPEEVPPAAAEERLLRAVAASSVPPRPVTSRVWQMWAIAASLVAAVLALFPVLHPTAPVAQERLLAVAIAPTTGGLPMAAVYRPATAHLTMPPAPLGGAGHSAELWLIGRDATPHALGVLDPVAPNDLVVPGAARALMVGGATIAVSVEPPGGSPTGRPTGPVVAKGILSRA